MPKREWSYRDGYRGGKVKPEVAGKELERIRKHRGGLRVDEVVEESRPQEAALHPEFEWDDFEAAEHYRKEQARRLIRAVYVTTNNAPPAPVYVYTPDKDHPQYNRTEVAAKRDDLRVRAMLHLRQQVSEAERSLDEFRIACDQEGASEQTMALLTVAAELAASLRQTVDRLQ